MIPVTYRPVCLAFLNQVWSSIRYALPVVTWPSRVGSNVAPAAQETAAAPAPVPPEATVAEDTQTGYIAHLAYLGYETGPAAPDGWTYASHSLRYNFHLRTFPRGVRLYCAVPIGASIGNSRAVWLEFLNTANERGLIAQFSLFEDKAGVHCVRMAAWVSGSYDRAAFAMAMDMWHDDLDIVRRKPEFALDGSVEEDEEVPAVTVN